jgi:hypothetical protein
MPSGVIVYDKRIKLIYSNVSGKHFLKRYETPVEFTALCKRIFAAIKAGSLKKSFPGEIYLTKKIEGPSSKWTFNFEICEIPAPLGCWVKTLSSLAFSPYFTKLRIPEYVCIDLLFCLKACRVSFIIYLLF